MFLTVFLSNETKKINAQHTDANRRNDVNSNRITENLARLADGLTNISIKIDSVAGELANVSSRIERVEVNLKEITVSYLEKPFSMYDLGNFTIECQEIKKGQKILQHCNHNTQKQMLKADIENKKTILEANN